MRWTRQLAVVGLSAAAGCSSTRPAPVPTPPPIFGAVPQPANTIVQASHVEPTPPEKPPLTELTAVSLVRVVLERNPTLEQMRAVEQAAAARFPQVTSLDDPMVGVSTAPFSAGSPNTDFAARVEISQKLFYPGKRGLKGQAAAAAAHAAGWDVDEAKLRLVEAAITALADLYAAEKGRMVAEENRRLLTEFKKNATTRYMNGQSPQQDVLQADVELARQEERLIAYRRAVRVAQARLNTLMHLPTDSPLPPPTELAVGRAVPDVAVLRTKAIATRPDLKALMDRVNAEEANLSLTVAEYKPDVDVFAAYDGFWQGMNGRPLQWQIGARVNLPTRQTRRGGAVAEARAKVAERRAELTRLVDQVGLQVQEAVEQMREANDVAELYEKKAIPAAEANVKAAQTAYMAGSVSFLVLVEAQRVVIGLKERYYEAVAESIRRQAALTRAVGEWAE